MEKLLVDFNKNVDTILLKILIAIRLFKFVLYMINKAELKETTDFQWIVTTQISNLKKYEEKKPCKIV